VKMQILAGIALASLLALSAAPAMHADSFDRATEVQFGVAVRVPGRVLPAGTYWFEIADHGLNPIVIQIFNADRTHLITTLETAAAERMEPTGKTVLTFAEPDTDANPNGQVPALMRWFYPGNDIGTQFIYSNRRERQFRHEARLTVPVETGQTVAMGD